MKRDKLLEQAISEAESFLRECKVYQKRINESYVSFHLIERGTLKARSLLLIRKLQAWRKNGSVE